MSGIEKVFDTPGYLKLHREGELKRRGALLWEQLQECRLCPRDCKVNRLAGDTGTCNATGELEISSCHAHFGEERGLVGNCGSGTIFFTHCSLRCTFCINGDISMEGAGQVTQLEDLAGMMLKLQEQGCHNINIVTPTHYSPHLLMALDIAAGYGLRIPLVYNTSSYEHREILQLLHGVVDIYLADMKYADGDYASTYSDGASDYPDIAQKAILEMHDQVGTARPNKNSLIKKGLMIRHLVMPNNVSGSLEILQWIAENLPKDTYVNLMSQYRPSFKARSHSEISRSIYRKEYEDVVQSAHSLGLKNLDIQGGISPICEEIP